MFLISDEEEHHNYANVDLSAYIEEEEKVMALANLELARVNLAQIL